MFRYTDWDMRLKGGVCVAIAVLCIVGAPADGRDAPEDPVGRREIAGSAIGNDSDRSEDNAVKSDMDALVILGGGTDVPEDADWDGFSGSGTKGGMPDGPGNGDMGVLLGNVDGHEHEWIAATCAAPKTCAVCGETVGGASLWHEWAEATCTEPKTCSVCGRTDGEPVHAWTSAACTEPKTCSVCGAVDGEPLGHKLRSYGTTVVKAACQEYGREETPCTRSGCDYVEEKIVPMAAHVAGSWKEIGRTSTSVTRARYCENCGIEMDRTEAPVSGNDVKAGSGSAGSGSWGGDSTTDEITGPLGRTAYWTPGGKSYHFSAQCPSLANSKNIETGTLQDALDAGKKDTCNNCAGGS